MALEIWQIANARRALDTFCLQHSILPGEGADHQLSDRLLELARRGLRDPEQLCAALEEADVTDKKQN
jgi:hypothetical protein